MSQKKADRHARCKELRYTFGAVLCFLILLYPVKILSEILGIPRLEEVYLFRAVGKMRTSQSDLVAICGLSLLCLAAGLVLPGRARPGCAVEAQHFKRTFQWLSLLGLTSRLYSNSPRVYPETQCSLDGECCLHRKRR